MTLVLGADPGLNAALAIFRGGVSPSVVDILDMPTLGEQAKRVPDVEVIAAWIKRHAPPIGYVERAMPMPDTETGVQMSPFSTGRYMRAFGMLEAAVTLSGCEKVLVMPAQWKRFFGITGPNKRDSIGVALELCPDAARWLKLRKHHNRAEAILIAVYGAARQGFIKLAPVDAPAAKPAPQGLPF